MTSTEDAGALADSGFIPDEPDPNDQTQVAPENPDDFVYPPDDEVPADDSGTVSDAGTSDAGRFDAGVIGPLDASVVAFGHPRLWHTSAGWNALPATLAANPTLSRIVALMKADADRRIAKPEALFNCAIPSGNIGRVAMDRVYLYGFLAKILPANERAPYAARAVAELMEVVTKVCFNLSDGADLVEAEYAHAVAAGYDLLYSDLSPAQRTSVSGLLMTFIDFARNRLGAGTAKVMWWTTAGSNWNLVCNGGFGLAALAVLHDVTGAENARAIDLLNRILSNFGPDGGYGQGSIRYGLKTYAPNGDWYEGPSYWVYATQYAVTFMAALDAAGADAGLANTLSTSPGFADSFWYRMFAEGPAGISFNYSDSPDDNSLRRDTDFALHYLARFLNGDAALRAQHTAFDDLVRRGADGGLDMRPNAAASHLLSFRGVGQATPIPTDFKQFSGVAFLRSSWANDAAWVGLLAGANLPNTHEHLDMGSFAYQVDGVDWIGELGSDSYSLAGYGAKPFNQGYYRVDTKGHNTLWFAQANQPFGANVKGSFIGAAKSVAGRSLARIDITSAYAGAPLGMTKVFRGAALVGDAKKVLVVSDQLQRASTGANVAVQWQMHARKAAVALEDNAQVLRLTRSGKVLKAFLVSPAAATFASTVDNVRKCNLNDAGVATTVCEFDRKDWTRMTIALSLPAVSTQTVQVVFVPDSVPTLFAMTRAQLLSCIAQSPNCIHAGAEAVLKSNVQDWN